MVLERLWDTLLEVAVGGEMLGGLVLTLSELVKNMVSFQKGALHWLDVRDTYVVVKHHVEEEFYRGFGWAFVL